MKSPLKRATEIATYQLWPKIAPHIKPTAKPEHLAKLNKFIGEYSQIMAHDEAGDDRITMQMKLSWDSVWERHIKRTRGDDAG